MKMRITYIHSLPRSGSTFLQTLLGYHPGVLSLGEMARAARNYSQFEGRDAIDEKRETLGLTQDALSNRPCSCGATRAECSFWGPLLPTLSGQTEEQAHDLILKRGDELHPGSMVVDSSKSLESLTRFYIDSGRHKQIDVRVVFLIRDFRGWVPSVLKHNKVRYKHSNKLPWSYGYVQDSYRWLRANRRSLKALSQMPVPSLVVSLERLSFDFESELNRIAGFLELDAGQLSRGGSEANVHELYGSVGLKRSGYRASVRYDHGWLTDRRPIVYAPLLGPVYGFNREVYQTLSVSSPRESSRRAA